MLIKRMGQTPSTRPAPSSRPASAEHRRTPSLFVEALARRLANLCAATGLSASATQEADRVFRDLVVPWSRVETFARGVGRSWVSEISDDNTPIEFSVTLSPTGSEVRVLFEPQGEDGTLGAHREAALQMHESLARDYGADLSRFRIVADLFTPADMRGPFALWSAVVFSDRHPPSFKAYFNPQAQGPGQSVALVEEGLRRVGLEQAWGHLASTLARRGPHRDELKYFALDLTASEQARVKVYVRHHEATPDDLELASSASPDTTPGEALDFARAMGGGARRFQERATFTCAAFVGGLNDQPSATTQYVPVCAYALDDLEVQERVSAYLRAHDMSDVPYRNVLSAFANRPLEAGVGMQSWVAFRRYQGVPRLTVYLGTESRCVFSPGSVPAGTRDHMMFDSAAQVLECVEQYALSEHPTMRRLVRDPDSGLIVWLLAQNICELLTQTTEVSAAALRAWLSNNTSIGQQLPESLSAEAHTFADNLEYFATSPDEIEALAARFVARAAVRPLATTLSRMLNAEETSSVGLSLDAILRDAKAGETELLSQLDAVGPTRIPSVVRGAFGMHRELWCALDRFARLTR